MAKKADNSEIDENKIRQTIWMLDHNNATKKAACEFLGIAYNTKRLAKIIEDYQNKKTREETLRAKNKNKVFTKLEIDSIIKDYVSGMAISNIAKNMFITDYKVRKILTENNVPLRGRGKKKPAKTEHIVQDLNVKFKVDEKVFYSKESVFAIIDKVYDEDLVEYLLNPDTEIYEEHKWTMEDRKGKTLNNFSEMKEDVHYTVYYLYPDKSQIKRSSISNIIRFTENGIADTGREFYRIWTLGDYSCYKYVPREDLIPIREN